MSSVTGVLDRVGVKRVVYLCRQLLCICVLSYRFYILSTGVSLHACMIVKALISVCVNVSDGFSVHVSVSINVSIGVSVHANLCSYLCQCYG